MRLSRRDFIHAGCAAGVVTLVPHFLDVAEARVRGIGIVPTTNAGRVSLNVPGGGVGLMNLASAWPVGVPIAQQDSNGYPTGTLASNADGNLPFVPNYYGQYVLQYRGQGAVNLFNPAIVYSGGSAIAGLVSGGGPAGTGYVAANFQTSASSANPSVVFKFGGLVASVSGGNGSLVTITTVAALNFTGISTGTSISLNQGCSSNLSNGPNPDGSWTVTNVSSTSFTLNNSTGVISPTVTGSGGVGTQTECIIQAASGTCQYNGSVAFTGFTALIICKQADLAALNSGQFYRADFVAQLQALRGTPGGVGKSGKSWLRFMDVSGVQASFECDFSQRIPTTQQCWTAGGYVRSGYLTPSGNNAITNGGSDNYTCADPSVSTLNAGNYIDNAIVQGIPSATNTGGNPTLAVGTGPAKPIFNYGNTFTGQFKITAAPTSPGTDVLQFTFQATWLNSNVAVTCSYQTVSGDSNTTTLANNLQTFFNGADANATICRNAGIVFINPQNATGPCFSAPTAQAGRLTATYSSGTATISVQVFGSGGISASGVGTFVYNYLLDGWIYRSGSMLCCQPFESIVELCNRVGANLWYTVGFTKSAFITALYQFFGDSVTGLTNGLQCGLEPWNEMWNSGANPHGTLQLMGHCFGWVDGGNQSDSGFGGLRAIQYCNVASTAWTGKGRNSSDLYMLQMSQTGNGVGSGFDVYQLQGRKLITSNSFYANYGGLNGGSETDRSTFPNRPVDFPAVFIGLAPYWNNKYLGNGSFTSAAQISGTVAQNDLFLQAAFNYATGSNGGTSAAFASLVNQFNRIGVVGPDSGALDFVSMQGFFTQQESIAAQFDSGRSIKVGINHYEGGPSFGIGNNGNAGVNSSDNQSANLLSADITALANRYSALGWTTMQLIPYTPSGTGNLTEMATIVLQLLQGWKYDLNFNGTAANTSSYSSVIKTSYYQALATTSAANRETHAGQYGYAGSNWGMWWNAYNTVGNSYQNYQAMAEWNT